MNSVENVFVFNSHFALHIKFGSIKAQLKLLIEYKNQIEKLNDLLKESSRLSYR
jgi:hypothetical protein